MVNNFSKEILEELFKCDKNGCLLTTESYDIEYKANLNIDADLFKTMNGLANNRGGYFICGVKPNNRELSGLLDAKINFYNTKIDSEEMRGRILGACQPNILYKHYLHNIGTAKFVVFYIPESKNKPHVFSNSFGEINQGDIYFRYNDSIKKIQYAELGAIIEEKRVKEQEKWMKFLGEIAKIGLDNVLIIDAKNGKMISSDNCEQGIVLDEKILSQFKLIHEGHFNEISGDPTLKLIGNIQLTGVDGKLQLSSDIMSVMDTNMTHPYRVVDIFNKLVDEHVKTIDDRELTEGKVTYHRVRFFIENNELNVGTENIYVDNATKVKKYSNKVYNAVKNAFMGMSLKDIESLKLLNKENQSC